MGHDIFLRFSSRNETEALAIAEALEAAGIRIWMPPRDIIPDSKLARSDPAGDRQRPGHGADLLSSR